MGAQQSSTQGRAPAAGNEAALQAIQGIVDGVGRALVQHGAVGGPGGLAGSMQRNSGQNADLYNQLGRVAFRTRQTRAGQRTRAKSRFVRSMLAFGANNIAVLGGAAGETFEGNQIRLPALVMDTLFDDSPVGEHVYRVKTQQGCFSFGGVKDYASTMDDACVLPRLMMEQLGLADGDTVELALMNATATYRTPLVPMPIVARLRLRWEHTNQYDQAWALPNSDALALQTALERAVDENYPVLMLNDVVQFQHSGVTYNLRVIGLRKCAPSPSATPLAGDNEEAQIQQAIAASLAEVGEELDDVVPGEVVQLRVPPWEAFERRLIIEPPQDWIPPPPFKDAVWDAEHNMYYPAGWKWNGIEGTYVAPLSAPTVQVPHTQHARSKIQGAVGQTPSSSSAAGSVPWTPETLPAYTEEAKPLSQAELRQKRIEAMEKRVVAASNSMAPVGATQPPPGVNTGEHGMSTKRAGDTPMFRGGAGVRRNMDHMAVRSYTIGGREGWEACHDISVEISEVACRQYFEKFQASGWACKWAVLYGTITSEGVSQNHTDNPDKPRVLPKSTVYVHAIWEPPQRACDAAYTGNEQGLGLPPQLLQVPAATAAVDAVAITSGLCRVGWLFTCPPRDTSFTMRVEEVLHAACLQLEVADGYTHGEPPFVTLRMSVEPSSSSAGSCEVTAWCATKQAMEMRAKGFFDVRNGASKFRDAARVAEGFYVIQEGRQTEHVDVSFLHRPLKITRQFDDPAIVDFGTVADAALTPSDGHAAPELPQVTRWAPSELREQFAFLDAGEGHRLGGNGARTGGQQLPCSMKDR